MSAVADRRRDAGEALLRRFAVTRDPRLREQLVDRYLPLARYAASRLASTSEPFEDLVQVACVGLLKAIDRYDPRKAHAFSSYALPTMSGELRRYLRDHGWAVRPPRDLQEQALAVDRATAALAHDLGRSPTVAEIAERTGLSEEEVLEAREALVARHAASLSAPARDDSEDPLEARIGVSEEGYDQAEKRELLERRARRLTRREREVVRLRFHEDLTQEQIGRIVGLSQMQISRVLREALEKLRQAA
jgi:RNA polymerase sigma-B factor